MEPMVQETGDAQLSYTVVRGDTLWDIASYRVIYGDPYQWPLIYKANTNQIDDADLIEPEWVLTIPEASASEVEAAIEHARTRGAWSLGVVEESDLAYLRQ
jgi:LysM repeat protein